jgi:NADH-quinone oxidoreductase subunit C
MTPLQIIQLLRERFPQAITAALPEDKHPRVHIEAADWRKMAEFLRNGPRLQFDWLANFTGIDYAADDQMCVCCDLWSVELRHRFAVKVFAPRGEPAFPSVADLWPAANWHEREAYDLFGMTFDGHPNLQRIFLPEDWVGHPLRKDYAFPKEYHGIPA